VVAAEDVAQAAEKPKGPSVVLWLVMLLVLGGVAGGAGAGLGMMMFTMVEQDVAARKQQKEMAEKPQHYVAGEQVVMLPPVVTNLFGDGDTWVRLELAAIFSGEAAEGRDKLAAQIAGDTLAFVRTLKLSQLRGATGLLHLREDLSERARIRSDGKVSEIVVHSLVLE
jgi:flagellar FliL protein